MPPIRHHETGLLKALWKPPSYFIVGFSLPAILLSLNEHFFIHIVLLRRRQLSLTGGKQSLDITRSLSGHLSHRNY